MQDPKWFAIWIASFHWKSGEGARKEKLITRSHQRHPSCRVMEIIWLVIFFWRSIDAIRMTSAQPWRLDPLATQKKRIADANHESPKLEGKQKQRKSFFSWPTIYGTISRYAFRFLFSTRALPIRQPRRYGTPPDEIRLLSTCTMFQHQQPVSVIEHNSLSRFRNRSWCIDKKHNQLLYSKRTEKGTSVSLRNVSFPSLSFSFFLRSPVALYCVCWNPLEIRKYI